MGMGPCKKSGNFSNKLCRICCVCVRILCVCIHIITYTCIIITSETGDSTMQNIHHYWIRSKTGEDSPMSPWCHQKWGLEQYSVNIYVQKKTWSELNNSVGDFSRKKLQETQKHRRALRAKSLNVKSSECQKHQNVTNLQWELTDPRFGIHSRLSTSRCGSIPCTPCQHRNGL